MKIDALPDRTRRRLRDFSRALFGNRHRLEIAVQVAMHGSDRLFAHALANRLRLADNVVRSELCRLEQAGMLRKVPAPDDGQKRIYYERLISCYWKSMTQLADEIVGRPRG